MRYMIYSDVHGNLPAFEDILKDAGNCDAYLCLGDLVNYGPWSNECVDLATSLPNSTILMGNHEEAFISGNYNGENNLVNEFFNHTIANFTRCDIIKTFNFSFKLNNFLCIHTIENKKIYQDTNFNLDDNYIIGHSHHQFNIEKNGFQLYNTGSVGQNRKYIDIANYLIFDIELNKIEMKSLPINIDFLLKEMKKNNYTDNCILYYKQKLIK